jgi:hypothetical protein
MYPLIIVKFLCSIVLVEAITEILTKSELFEPVRKFFFDRKKNKLFNKLHDLIDCGYCTSVWIGFFTALLIFSDVNFINKYIDWFIIGLILHRLANFLHSIFDWINKDKYKDMSL